MAFQRQTIGRTRRPHGQGQPRLYRTQAKRATEKLRTWVQQQKGLREPPSLNEALVGKRMLYPVK